MAKLRVSIPDQFFYSIKSKMRGYYNATMMMADAFTLFGWAVDEAIKGRTVFSSDENGHQVTRLSMPVLNNLIKKHEKRR